MECAGEAQKLDMDFRGRCGLRARMCEDQEFRRQLIGRLFTLITIAAEDAATIAADGQAGSSDPHVIRSWAEKSRELGERIEVLATAIEALNRDGA